jgi:hypothetical protein
MRTIRLVAGIGFVVMLVAIGHGLLHGDLRGEGAWLLANPWGRVSLVDLYTGFALIAAWIAYRERALTRSIPWIVALMLLGNLAACGYVLYASLGARRVSELLLGRPATP